MTNSNSKPLDVPLLSNLIRLFEEASDSNEKVEQSRKTILGILKGMLEEKVREKVQES